MGPSWQIAEGLQELGPSTPDLCLTSAARWPRSKASCLTSVPYLENGSDASGAEGHRGRERVSGDRLWHTWVHISDCSSPVCLGRGKAPSGVSPSFPTSALLRGLLGAVMYSVGCVAVSLASTFIMQWHHPPLVMTRKNVSRHCQVPPQGQIAPFETPW